MTTIIISVNASEISCSLL